MNRTAALTILVLLADSGEGLAASKIDEVLVFADRAKVKRVTTAKCSAGSATALFAPLPFSLDVRTLRGEGAGVIGVSSSVINDSEPVDERAKKITAEIEVLQEEAAAKNREQANLAQRQSRIRGYGKVFTQVMQEAIRDPRPSFTSWSASLSSFREQSLGLADQVAAVQKARRQLTRKIGKLQRKLARLGAGQTKQWRSAEVTVKCKGPTARVGLTYVLPGAEWRPEYDVDFTPTRGKVGSGRVKMTVAAVIRQSTGEDWTNAKIALSTAKPRLGSEAPYPAELWVGARKKQEGKVLVQGQERRNELQAGAKDQAQGPEGVELEDGGQAVVLRMPHRVTVVADGRPYWTPVEVLSVRATAKLVTTPKLRPYVFRAVAMNNPAAYPLLAGRVHAFRSGSYVGDTSITFKGKGEPMEISLGIDEELKVERMTRTNRNDDAGFLSSTKHMVRAYRIKVTNRSRTREKVEVRENMPVSKIEDVEVELIGEGTSRGYEEDKRRGFITWTIDLPRGASKEVDLAYKIGLPEDWKVR